MPRNKDIKKVLVIGSGPIVIGQAAEFDYAGTQACRSLKEEGVEVCLVNSNPATIMTDKQIADQVYIEPLTLPVLEKIILKEKPDRNLRWIELGVQHSHPEGAAMYRMTDEEFESAIAEALGAMPEQFLEALQQRGRGMGRGAERLPLWATTRNGTSNQRLSKTKMAANRIRLRSAMQKTTQQRNDAGERRRGGGRRGRIRRPSSGCSTGCPSWSGPTATTTTSPTSSPSSKARHERCFDSREEIVEEVGKTIIHELGHYFGLNEDQLAAMGYE